MNAGDLFKAGKLQDAIDAQIKAVKASPADHGKRIFLFEMFAFAGDLDKAKRQIEAVEYGEMERDTAVMSYRKLLEAEQLRRRLFSESLSPKFLIDPPERVKMRIEAVGRLREKKPAEAAELLAKATEADPALHGKLNDKPFESLHDGDDLFSSILEVMSQGSYYWVPLEQIESLAMNPPKYPRELIWFPAHLALKDGPEGDVFLPAIYPGSYQHPDDQYKLGRATDWHSTDGGPVLGVGARTFYADDNDIGLLEWRELQPE